MSSLELAKNPDSIEFLIFVDDDDSSMYDFSHPKARVLKGKRQAISRMTNSLAEISRGSLIMYAADDILFRTVDWDSIVLEHYANSQHKICLIHGEDLGQNADRIATHGFVSRELYGLLGYILPNHFKADFCDTWMTEVSTKSGTRVLNRKLIIEHMHPAWGKAPTDSTYRSTTPLFYLLNSIKYKILYRIRGNAIRKIKNYCAAVTTKDSNSE
jgi:hypothetical protein